MGLNAAAVRLLSEKGLSASDIADVMEAIEAKPRALTGAERAQRHRDKRADERNENNVTNVTPPNDIYSNPPVSSPEETIVSSAPKPKRPRASKAGEPLPEDWRPTLTPAVQKIVDSWPPGWLVARAAEFRDHARDKGRKSLDWQAAFRTWIIKADEWGSQKNGQRSQNFTGNSPRPNTIASVLDREIARSSAPSDGYPTGGTGGSGGTVARLAVMR